MYSFRNVYTSVWCINAGLQGFNEVEVTILEEAVGTVGVCAGDGYLLAAAMLADEGDAVGAEGGWDGIVGLVGEG
ncbi:hypothetical protein CK934_29200 [Chitinophaga sp. MD30]|nr:hypothetical protein CK934_29200 [Chitinophaga sp. MD30]